jgi:LPXTG-motif cell wall-anchored protein
MTDDRSRPPRAVRLLAAAAVLCLAGTFLAAKIDFVRRHEYGISPTRYWLPQLTHIWLPGLGAALLLAGAAFALHRRRRPD